MGRQGEGVVVISIAGFRNNSQPQGPDRISQPVVVRIISIFWGTFNVAALSIARYAREVWKPRLHCPTLLSRYRRSRCMMGRGDAGGDKTRDTSSRALTGEAVNTLITKSRSSAGSVSRPVRGKLRGPTGVGRTSSVKSRRVRLTTLPVWWSMLIIMFSVNSMVQA